MAWQFSRVPPSSYLRPGGAAKPNFGKSVKSPVFLPLKPLYLKVFAHIAEAMDERV